MTVRAVGMGMLLALQLLSACTCGPEVQCSVEQLFGDGHLVVGEEARIPAGLSVACTTTAPPGMPDEVVVEVMDPDNRRVAATVGLPVRTGTDATIELTTEIRFTPDRAGAWVVVARFEPGLGRSQQRFLTFVSPTDRKMRVLPTSLPADCSEWGITTRDVPLCVRKVPNADHELLIADQRFEGIAFAVDGEDLWRYRLSRSPWLPMVERLTPDATGVYAVSQAWSPPAGAFGHIAAGGGKAFFGPTDMASVVRLTPAPDGGLGPTPIALGPDRKGQMATVFRDDLLVLTFGGEVVLLQADGGSAVAALSPTLTPLANDGTLWALKDKGHIPNGFGRAATLVGVDAESGTVRSASVQIADDLPWLAFALSPQTPVVRVSTGGMARRAAVPVRGDGDLGLELFDAGPGFGDLVGATDRHAFARSADGKLLVVFDR